MRRASLAIPQTKLYRTMSIGWQQRCGGRGALLGQWREFAAQECVIGITLRHGVKHIVLVEAPLLASLGMLFTFDPVDG